MAVELSTTQFQACQDANGQFCSITTPFQPLANPPSCFSSSVCQEYSRYCLQMLTTDMQSLNYLPA